MELKSLKCPVCGASVDANKIDFTRKIAKCSSCDETFVIEQAEYFAKVEVDKSKDIKNYRTNLSVAVEKNNVEEIRRLAGNILDILPDDYDGLYFYAYALSKLGDSGYLYDFYKDTEKVYTEESATRVAEHVIANGELRDDGLIKEFLSNLEYNPQEFLRLYKETFDQRVNKEELYDDITRDVFICHRSTDGEIANGIVKLLEDDSNKCWISSRNLRPNDNDNYWDNIKKAIKSCRIFLVVSSRDAMMSPDVKKELDYAKDLNKRRLEVKIDDSEHTTKFKDFFDGCKWIKGVNKDEILERVADLLAKELSGKDNVVVHKVKKIDFTPIQAAKPVEKKIINDLHEHKYVKAETVPPTCTESGYTIYRCECGAEKKGDFTPKRTEHDFKVAERKEPTCTENGYIKYECVYCDATKKDVLPAKGHDYKLSDTKEPTCINDGHKIYKCSVCGDTKVETIAKIPHTFSGWVITKQPTCEKEGEETRQCAFCGKTETRPFPAKGHNYGKWVTEKEPTCTEKGVKARLCTDCGKKDYGEIVPTGHTFSAWQNLPDGKTQERICDKCGYVDKRIIAEYKEQKKQKKEQLKKKIFSKLSVSFFCIPVLLFLVGIIVFFANVSDLRYFQYRPLGLLLPFLLAFLFCITAFRLRYRLTKIKQSGYTTLFLTKSGKVWAWILLAVIWLMMTISFVICILPKEYDGYSQGYYYTLNEDGKSITLKDVHNMSGDVIIPSELNGYTVNGLDGAFYQCSRLTSITIGNSVTSIGASEFSGCSSLKSVTIGNSVTRIADYAFLGCSSLTSITIPNSVTRMGYMAFSGCSSLTSITFGGTKAQWHAMSSSWSWYDEVSQSCQVYCTDGNTTV